jgi:hypothetical protein
MTSGKGLSFLWLAARWIDAVMRSVQILIVQAIKPDCERIAMVTD